jgi:formate dehydrogenase subunit gamma
VVGKNMEDKSSFFARNKAYFYTIIGFTVFGFVLIKYLIIVDWMYVWDYSMHLLKGGSLAGIVVPADTGYKEMVNIAFGPNYTAVAPEIIRSSNERQLFIWWVFVAEIAIFCFAYAVYGRKVAVITRPNDEVQVFNLFHRWVIWLNVIFMIVLIITGFNITWSMRSEGGTIPFILREYHEIIGLFWVPIWFLMSLIAFKDCKIVLKGSLIRKIILPGGYKPMKRIIFFVFVCMGSALVATGVIIWFISPDAYTNAQFIQFKRASLYSHFGASVVIMFFLMDFVYSSLIAVKGNLKGLITGKYPREYLEQFAPDILEDLEKGNK